MNRASVSSKVMSRSIAITKDGWIIYVINEYHNIDCIRNVYLIRKHVGEFFYDDLNR